MVQLSRHRGQVSTVACDQRTLPAGTYSDAERRELQTNAVSELLADNQFIGQEAVTALSWDDLQARNLRIPPMPEQEIGSVVQFESAERFGVDPKQAEIRFIVSGDVRQGTEMKQEVMAFGARHASVETRVDMLAKLGLKPVALDAGPCAVFRGFERLLRRDDDRQEVNAFVDLGYSGTRVVISRGPDLIFFKAIAIGGRRFNEQVSEQLELSPDEAAQIRFRLHRQFLAEATGQTGNIAQDETVGENVRHAILDAVRPALEQLSKEISLCLRYCSVTFRGLRSEAITAVGGEARNADIIRLLSDQVNVPFRVGHPMRNIAAQTKTSSADRRHGQPEWATAVGLALKPVERMAEVAS